jgi:serine/threonine protein phosphatase PrpC
MPVHNLLDAAIEISTHQGGRTYQQDRATFNQDYSHITAAVADGMGSGAGSDKIAHMAATFATQIGSVYGPEHPGMAIKAAAECVRSVADDERGENDNTTLVLANVTMLGAVHVAWVGDSRAYVLTCRSRLYRLTKDHNYGPAAPNILKRTLLGPDLYHRHEPGDDCSNHTPEGNEYGSALDPVTMVALMTDGVCGVLTDDQIGHILRTAPNARRAARRLTGVAVRAAEAKGEKPDNATALVIDLQPRTEA